MNKWNLNDGVKEANIKMKEFGHEVPKALSDLLEGTDMSAKKMQAWGKEVAKGGKDGAKAMGEVADWLATIEDDALRSQLAIQVFGTKSEDQSESMIAVFRGLADAQDKSTQNAKQMNDAINAMDANPVVKLKLALENMMMQLQPIFYAVADIVGAMAQWAAENPKLTATIAGIAVVLGILVGTFAVLMPAIGALITAWPIMTAALATITAPVGLIVAGIAAVIAIAVLLIANWKEIAAYAKKLWDGQIKETFTKAFNAIKSVATTVMNSVWSFIKEIWGKLSKFWKENGEAIKILTVVAFDAIKTKIEFVMNVIKGIFQVVWPIISGVVKVAWGIMQTTIKNTIDIVLGIIQFFLKVLQGDWKGAWNTILNTIKSIMGNIKSFFKTVNLVQIGKDMIKGLIKGISSMAGAAVDAVKGVVGGAVKGAKKLLGIASPSKVFAKIGRQTNEGYIVGLEDTSRDLHAAVNDVYGSLASSASKSSANQTYVTQQTINNQSSDIDLSGLMSAIMNLANRPISLMVDGREIALATFPQTNRLLAQDSAMESLFKGVNRK